MTNAGMVRPGGVLVITLLLAACTDGGSQPVAAPTSLPGSVSVHAAATTSNDPRTGTATPIPTARPTEATATTFCQTAIPASWKAAQLAEDRDGYDWGMTAKGHVRWTGLELTWVARDGAESRIATLPEPGGLGTVTMAGDHVAFFRQRSDQNGDDWELFLWDSTGRHKPVKLDESDGLVASPTSQSATGIDTHLAWLHPLKDGRSELRLHDLTTGGTRVVHVGHEQAPLIAGHLLLWPESSAAGAPTRLVAVDLRTLRRTALPKPQADLHDPQEMSADAQTYAWTSKDQSRLMVWRQGWPTPKIIVENSDGNPVTGLRVSGDTVSWSAGRTYTADLRSSSYAPMTSQWGRAEVWGTFLHIGIPKVAGSGFLLDTSKLPPLTRCRT